MREVVAGRVCVAVVSMLVCAGAWGLVGSGELSGKEKFKVSHCGSEGGPVSVDLTLNGNFTFSLVSEGRTYSGTYTENGTALTFTLDQASLTQLSDVIAGNASDLCSATVTVNSLTINGASVKLNKSKTSAKLTFAATASGSADGQTGTATFQLKAGGSFNATP